MRVVSGIYRSRILKAPEGMNTRPTMDKVKEAMFSIIGDKVVDSVVVDLFSGSGGLGIEALSRGAKYVYFNDNSIVAFHCIQDNLKALNIKDSYSLSKKSYLSFLSELTKKVDLILLDPPYKKLVYEEVINYLNEHDLLNEHAYFMLEADSDVDLIQIEGFTSKEYVYGNTKLMLLKKD